MLSHKKIIFAALSGLFLAWCIASDSGDITGIQLASAQLGPQPFGGNNATLTGTINELLGYIFHVVNFFAYLSLWFLSILLDPEVIEEINTVTGEVSGTPMLQLIWQISRDIVNVIFAFMLIFAALYTVVTANRELINQHIAKFIIAVILVNFSWFFPRVILDVANVLAATVHSIPATIDIKCETTDIAGNPVPCKYIKRVWFNPTNPSASTGTDAPPAGCQLPGNGFEPVPGNPNIIKPIEDVCIEMDILPDDSNTGLAILHGLYVNHIHLTTIAQVVNLGGPVGGGIFQIIRYLLQFTFVIFYLIAAVFPLLTMVIVFFVRIPMIWITTAFMPFMFIGFVAGEKMGQFNTMDLIFKKFITAAFLPALVAVPLTIGYIMISAAITSSCPSDASALGLLCGSHGILLPGVSSLWMLTWSIMAIVIMWVGFFSVLQVDNIYQRIGQTFQNVGQSWGSLAVKAPLAGSFIPLPGGATPLQLLNAAKNPSPLFIRDGKFQDLDKVIQDVSGGKTTVDSAGAKKVVADIENGKMPEVERLLQKIVDGDKDAVGEAKNRLSEQGIDFSRGSAKTFWDEYKSRFGDRGLDDDKTNRLIEEFSKSDDDS